MQVKITKLSEKKQYSLVSLVNGRDLLGLDPGLSYLGGSPPQRVALRFKCENSCTVLGKYSIHVSNCYYTIIISSKTSTRTKSRKETHLLSYQDCGFHLQF